MTTPGQLIKDAINAYCVSLYSEPPRSHLGFSTMGEECDRKLFLNFRHAGRENFDGRMYRLFNVGHSAEPRFTSYLRGIGFIVEETDPTTGKQFKVTSVNGHYAGSCDGILTATEATAVFGLTVGERLLVSFKTNGTGAGYNSVSKDGFKKAKPRHWIQECQYGYKMGIKSVLYLIENKNDSDITVEIAELDFSVGQDAERRAERIINGTLPRRIAESPAFYSCKFCTFNENCFHGKDIAVNCRSCVNSKPVENGQWYCERWSALIPTDAIPNACQDWKGVL